jgi:hypothetical protein
VEKVFDVFEGFVGLLLVQINPAQLRQSLCRNGVLRVILRHSLQCDHCITRFAAGPLFFSSLIQGCGLRWRRLIENRGRDEHSGSGLRRRTAHQNGGDANQDQLKASAESLLAHNIHVPADQMIEVV